MSASRLRGDLCTCWLLGLLTACAGAPPPPAQPVAAKAQDDAVLRDPILDEVMEEEKARRAARQAAAEPQPAKTGASAAPRSDAAGPRTVGVRGITGSLTAFEVEAAMRTHSSELLACVAKRPRRLGHVAGDIAFHVEVDGQGKVERARVMESNLGYLPLEDCLTSVVANAPFPVPAGAQPAETQWRMSVDPLRRPAQPLDSEALEQTITRQSEATYERCEIGRGRRFDVSGYLGRGKLEPVSVRAPFRKAARKDEESPELTCLAEELSHWKRWPKARGYAKVSFELRWIAAPVPPRKRARARRPR